MVSEVNMNKISILVMLALGIGLISCKTAESTLTMENVRNYNRDAASHILFLDFKLTKRNDQTETVTLVNAVSGSGKIKNMAIPVHSACQISVIPRYSVGRLEVPLVFEHPLYRSVEVPSQDGKLTKQDLHADEGTLSVRIQTEKGLEKLELYSLTPEKGNVKIYTLNLK
jgi:hypothetical protein